LPALPAATLAAYSCAGPALERALEAEASDGYIGREDPAGTDAFVHCADMPAPDAADPWAALLAIESARRSHQEHSALVGAALARFPQADVAQYLPLYELESRLSTRDFAGAWALTVSLLDPSRPSAVRRKALDMGIAALIAAQLTPEAEHAVALAFEDPGASAARVAVAEMVVAAALRQEDAVMASAWAERLRAARKRCGNECSVFDGDIATALQWVALLDDGGAADERVGAGVLACIASEAGELPIVGRGDGSPAGTTWSVWEPLNQHFADCVAGRTGGVQWPQSTAWVLSVRRE
jgi:hypothetical protein